jgi:hypothetical protein
MTSGATIDFVFARTGLQWPVSGLANVPELRLFD